MTSQGDRLLVWSTGSGSTAAGSETALLDIESGEILWSATTERTVTVASMTPERVALSTDRRISVLDADTGEMLWSREDTSLEEVVIGSERVYGVGYDCEVVAVDPDERRWDRNLEIRDCTVIDGWIDGNTVAFLFESGDIVWLQRTAQNPGLLW